MFQWKRETTVNKDGGKLAVYFHLVALSVDCLLAVSSAGKLLLPLLYLLSLRPNEPAKLKVLS